MDYADFRHRTFDRRPSGVVLITINRPEVMNATNARLHWELTQVWLTIDANPAARVALVTGAGRALSVTEKAVPPDDPGTSAPATLDKTRLASSFLRTRGLTPAGGGGSLRGPR